MFLRAEQAGLKLASIGRIAALALLGVWLIGTRADDAAILNRPSLAGNTPVGTPVG